MTPAVHRAMQALLNLPNPVSRDDLATCIADGGNTTDFMVKKTVSRLRYELPLGLEVRSIRGGGGYEIGSTSMAKCRTCPTEIKRPKVKQPQFCPTCKAAFMLGFKAGKRKAGLHQVTVRVRRAVRLGDGLGSGGLGDGSGAGFHDPAMGQGKCPKLGQGTGQPDRA